MAGVAWLPVLRDGGHDGGSVDALPSVRRARRDLAAGFNEMSGLRSDSWMPMCNDPRHKQFGELTVEQIVDVIEARNLQYEVFQELRRRGKERHQQLQGETE